MAKATSKTKAGASLAMPKVQLRTAGIAGGLKHWIYAKRFYLIAFFICVSLMVNDVAHLFICVLPMVFF